MSFPGSVHHLDDEQIKISKATTTGATQTALFTAALPTNFAGRIRAVITARKSDGTDRATYERVATFYRAAGAGALQGPVVVPVPASESVAAWDADIDVSSSSLRVLVTGAAATTIHWTARIELVVG